MRTKRVILVALSIVARELTILALPAIASGSFTWTSQFTHRGVSRTYSTPNTGTHSIKKTDAPCPRVGDKVQIRVVKQNIFGDNFYAWKWYDCGTFDQTRTWAVDRTGDFHFDIEKADTNDTTWAWTVYGVTSYP